MSKRRVISYSKWEEVAKLSVKKDFFSEFSCQRNERETRARPRRRLRRDPTHRTRIKHTRTLIVRKFIVIEFSPTTTTTTTTPSDEVTEERRLHTKITLGPNF